MLYLASGSPRRAELLAQIGVPFTVLKAPGIDETVHAGEAPRDYVARMAREKAAAGRAAAPGPEPVLGADTAALVASGSYWRDYLLVLVPSTARKLWASRKKRSAGYSVE